jgi:hypothetical protein
MTGRAAAIILVLALSPARLQAQDLVLTVNVDSADVHKAPSIATPVIGHVPRGTAVPVLRNLGSWVKIDWPDGPDGFGYLHVTTGRLAVRASGASSSKPAGRRPSGAASASTASASAGSQSPAPSASSSSAVQTAKPPRPRHERVVIRSQQDSTPISHIVGVGGVFGSMSSFGVTSRGWRDNRLGLQIGFSRDSMTSSTAPGRVTAMELEPAVVYGLFDHVSDYFWVRPYVGSGLSIRHQSLQAATPTSAHATSSTGVGFRAFGGAEVTFAGAPRFAVSVDAGYRRFPTPFPGFEPAHFSAFVSGHWYVK